MEFFQIWHKHSLRLKNELRSNVKVTVTYYTGEFIYKSCQRLTQISQMTKCWHFRSKSSIILFVQSIDISFCDSICDVCYRMTIEKESKGQHRCDIIIFWGVSCGSVGLRQKNCFTFSVHGKSNGNLHLFYVSQIAHLEKTPKEFPCLLPGYAAQWPFSVMFLPLAPPTSSCWGHRLFIAMMSEIFKSLFSVLENIKSPLIKSSSYKETHCKNSKS